MIRAGRRRGLEDERIRAGATHPGDAIRLPWPPILGWFTSAWALRREIVTARAPPACHAHFRSKAAPLDFPTKEVSDAARTCEANGRARRHRLGACHHHGDERVARRTAAVQLVAVPVRDRLL